MSDFDHGLLPRQAVGMTSALIRTAQVRGHHPALVDDHKTRTWAELQDRIQRVSAGLRQMGLKDGDRIAILSKTNDRHFEMFAATPHAGGVIVPLNWRWRVAELADAIADSEPHILFVDEHSLEVGHQLTAGRPEMILAAIGEQSHGLPHYEALVADNAPGVDAGRGGDDLYQLGYTGGTTGRSKAAMLSHRNVLSNAMMAWAEGFYGADARYLFSGPMFHASGSWPCIAIMAAGGTGVLMSQFEPGEALRLIERHKATEGLLVPTMIQMLIEHPDFARRDTSSFRTLIYGAAPITATLLERATAAFPQAKFIQAYGMTELSPMCASLPDEFLREPYKDRGLNRAAGRATYCVEIKIVDEHDNEVPRGQVGEIVARGENVMLGYWRRPEETARAMRGGWMHTGDAGKMDEDGFIYVVDRIKDMIISGGENIYSTEVENAVCQHPAVRQCVVIGIPSEKWGEAVHAVVRLHDGHSVTETEIIEHCHALIAGYKVPRSVAFWEGEFPISPANKILKREIRRLYWEGRERCIV